MKLIPETIGDQVLLHCNAKYGNRSKAAKSWGLSPSFVAIVCQNRKTPSKVILDDMGLRRVVTYEAIAVTNEVVA